MKNERPFPLHHIHPRNEIGRESYKTSPDIPIMSKSYHISSSPVQFISKLLFSSTINQNQVVKVIIFVTIGIAQHPSKNMPSS
jgi:hypothetical protein